MTLPSADWVRVTHFFDGTQLPRGAAVGYAAEVIDEEPMTDSIANEVHDAFVGNILPVLSASITCTGTLLKQGPDATGVSVLHLESDTGGDANLATSPQIAIILNKTTASGGRRGRGRMFLPGAVEANVTTAGLWASGFVTAMGAAITNWLTAFNTIATLGSLALEHEPPTIWILSNGQPRRVPDGTAPDPTLITGVQLDPRCGTQRRRNRA